MLRIGVLGLCDTGNLTNSLRFLLPHAEITPVIWPDIPDVVDHIIRVLTDARCEILILSEHRAPLELLERFKGKIIQYPHITFRAFHPDLDYIKSRPEDYHFIEPAYNSRIVAWSYLHGLSRREAGALFNTEIFEALGYYEDWNNSCKLLSKDFKRFGLDFDAFHLRLKRTGVFMHSTNHPTLKASYEQARCIIRAHDIANVLGDVLIPESDGLANFGWPIYPEIAANLGIAGTYIWRIKDRYYNLEEFIDWSYGVYDALELKSKEPEFLLGAQTLDEVLGGVVR